MTVHGFPLFEPPAHCAARLHVPASAPPMVPIWIVERNKALPIPPAPEKAKWDGLLQYPMCDGVGLHVEPHFAPGQKVSEVHGMLAFGPPVQINCSSLHAGSPLPAGGSGSAVVQVASSGLLQRDPGQSASLVQSPRKLPAPGQVPPPGHS